MIIGVTPFKTNLNSSVFHTRIGLSDYLNMEIRECLLDEIYIDENVNLPYTKEKPISFLYSTILNAKFKNNLEAGNIQANGFNVEYILVQKRQIDSTKWTDVAKIKANSSVSYFEILDRYISLNEEYEYTVVPITQNIYGTRSDGNTIKTHFNGMFLSDKDHNYAFMCNVNYNDITHNNPKKTHQTFGSKYPVVIYSDINYSEFNVKALIITYDELSGKLNLKVNKTHRKQVIDWLNNGKPKVYRDNRGDLKIVTVSDNITEHPVEGKEQLNDITIGLVEIGDINTDLEMFNLLPKYGGD
jgi:hypothetical protein